MNVEPKVNVTSGLLCGRPDRDFLLMQGAPGIDELGSITALGLDLPRVATHDDRIHVVEHLGKIVVLPIRIVDQVACHASVDHTIAEWDRVITMAVDALVRTAELMALNVNLRNARTFLRFGGLRE